jgi:hypothetical protein
MERRIVDSAPVEQLTDTQNGKVYVVSYKQLAIFGLQP